MANTLDDAQRQKVKQWIDDGRKLSEIQKQLETDFGLRMTYLDVRLLVDDLKLMPKDQTPVTPKDLSKPAPAPADAAAGTEEDELPPVADEPAAPGGRVTVAVDALARPGAIVSGKVTFSDGNRASWYLDQTGRLGVSPDIQGYKPPQQDIIEFQTELQNELAKMGY